MSPWGNTANSCSRFRSCAPIATRFSGPCTPPAGWPTDWRSTSASSSTRGPRVSGRRSPSRQREAFVLSVPMRYIYSSIWGRGERWVIPVVLATSYITALVLRIVINIACQHFINQKPFTSPFDLFEGALMSTYLLLCWSGLYFGIKYYESKQQQQEAVLKAVTLGAGNAAEDAALPVEPALPLQHPQRHLHADSRQSEPHGQSCGHASLGVPALHTRPGPDEDA